MRNTRTDISALMMLDDLCTEFESRFTQGATPRIGDYLHRVEPIHRVRLLHELVALEIGLLGRGEALRSVDELLDQYGSYLTAEDDRGKLRSTIENAVKAASAHESRNGIDTTAAWDGSRRDEHATLPDVDGYKIESVLGRGGMGVVYRAVHTELNRAVALKMILDGGSATREDFTRFQREAKAIASLNDPRFVQIYDFGMHGGRPYMTLEYVPGGSLEAYRAGEPQSERFAAETVATLSEAMHKAHLHDLVHRDLKPQNVLLTAEGQPKIADFGLVKRQRPDDSQMTEHGRVMGTAAYMSPEQSRGEEVNATTDVYAMGAILYCLLTGRPPFLGENIYDTIQQVRHQEAVAPSHLRPGLSKDLETICLKCLEKDAKKRYASALDLAEDLRRYLEGRPIVARPVGALYRGWRWARRNPLAATVAGLVFAIAVISTVMTWRLFAANEQLQLQTTRANSAREAETREHGKAVAARQAKTEQYNEVLQAYHDVLYTSDKLLRNNKRDVAVRKTLIRIAMDSLGRVRDDDERNTLLDRNEAIGCQRLGDICVVVGDLKQALAEYQRAYAVTADAWRDEPSDLRHCRNLAVLCDKQAEVLRRLGDTLGARDKYQEGLELGRTWDERLLALGTDHKPAKKVVAMSYVQLGGIHMSLGDTETALKHFTSAQEWYRKLPREELESMFGELATLEHWLGEAHYHQGNADDAENFLTRAASKRARLFKEENSVSRLDELSRSRLVLGDYYLADRKDMQKALVNYRAAWTGYKEWWTKNQDSAAARAAMGDIEYRIGALLLCAKEAGVTLSEVPDGDDPKTHFAACCALREELAAIDPDDLQAKIEWAVSLARCDRAAEAEEQANILVEKGEKNPRLLFQAACTYALCSTTGDEELASRCRERALGALDQLVDAGWKDRAVLLHDPDLDPIRSEARFQELMARLTGASPQ